MRTRAGNGIVWCHTGFFPVHIGFCPTARAFIRELRHHGFNNDYPADDACVTEYDSKAGDRTFIVTVNEDLDARCRRDKVFLATMLCHEAVHVWQGTRVKMAETNPSAEFEAYTVSYITEQLCAAYLKTRGAKVTKRPRRRQGGRRRG